MGRRPARTLLGLVIACLTVLTAAVPASALPLDPPPLPDPPPVVVPEGALPEVVADPPVELPPEVTELVEDCYLWLTSEDPLPFGTTACPGVRPGAAVISELMNCTLNFVVIGRNAELKITRHFIGTAGHCILEQDGTKKWAGGAGPIARDSTGNEIGRFVYARRTTTQDFALIELASGVTANPQMCHFGGPMGIDSGQRNEYTPVGYYGQGFIYQSSAPARTGLMRSLTDPDQLYFDGPSSLGDSGAGVIGPDARALGIIVSLTATVSGTVRLDRLRPLLDSAGNSLNLTMSVVTAAGLAPVTEPGGGGGGEPGGGGGGGGGGG